MTQPSKIRLLIADGHEVVRSGLKSTLEGTEIKVVAEVATGQAAVNYAMENEVDVVLLDVQMPDGDGLTALGRIKLDKPTLPILMFSRVDDPAYIDGAVALEASGHLSKGYTREELLCAIRAAAGENTWARERAMTLRFPTVATRCAALLLFAVVMAQSPAVAMDIVKAGRPAAVIVIPDVPLPAVAAAADELQYHLRKATGARLDVVKENAAPQTGARVYLGMTRAATENDLKVGSGTANAFRIKLVGSSLFILGDDSDGPVFGVQQSNYTRVGTLFGAYEFLEKRLGVRWLWPGELGEVIPPACDVTVESWDQSGRPPFIHTRWRDKGATAVPEGWSSPQARAKYLRELGLWLRRHRFAMGVNMDMAHSFTNWWDRFSKGHPEYFNLLPDGTRRSDPTYGRGHKTLISMSVGEPGLWRQKIADWLAQRSPQAPYIDATENDTDGRCLCEKCLALDEPDPAADVPFDRRVAIARERFAKKDPHWTAVLGSLSDRYARYYLAVQREAEKYDPQAVVMGYSYANYVKPPRNTKLNERIIIGIVPALMYPWTQAKRDAFRTQWDGWATAGARLFLRPNYMLDGHNLPIFFARKRADAVSYAARDGLIGTDFDSLTGQWAAQGPNLYVLARLHQCPTMGVDKVLDEYYGAFGPAAPAVRAYFAHWEKVSDAVTDEVAKAAKLHWAQFYHDADRIFTPAVLSAGRALLEKAAAAAQGDRLAAARVTFLAQGLTHAELTLAVQRAYRQYKQRGDVQAYAAALKRLDQYRTQVEGSLVADMSFLRQFENRTWDRKATKVSLNQ